jgi:hypothetical protein
MSKVFKCSAVLIALIAIAPVETRAQDDNTSSPAMDNNTSSVTEDDNTSPPTVIVPQTSPPPQAQQLPSPIGANIIAPAAPVHNASRSVAPAPSMRSMSAPSISAPSIRR